MHLSTIDRAAHALPHTTRTVFRVPHTSPLQAVATPSHSCNACARWLTARPSCHAASVARPPPPDSLPRLTPWPDTVSPVRSTAISPPLGTTTCLSTPARRPASPPARPRRLPAAAQSCFALCPITLYFWRICCGSPTSPSAIRSGPSRLGLAKNGVSCCCSKMMTEFHTFLGPIK